MHTHLSLIHLKKQFPLMNIHNFVLNALEKNSSLMIRKLVFQEHKGQMYVTFNVTYICPLKNQVSND